jgi:hypothetical protein
MFSVKMHHRCVQRYQYFSVPEEMVDSWVMIVPAKRSAYGAAYKLLLGNLN